MMTGTRALEFEAFVAEDLVPVAGWIAGAAYVGLATKDAVNYYIDKSG